MENNEKQLKVNAIKNGTVLDHIPSGQVFKVINILGLSDSANPVTFGINLDSKSMGNKGIIKISERFFKDNELSKIALIAPNASINIIQDYEVVKKKRISLPKEVIGIAKCMNPMCVTNHQDIQTKFTTLEKEGHIVLLCHYCEKATDLKNLKIISNSR